MALSLARPRPRRAPTPRPLSPGKAPQPAAETERVKPTVENIDGAAAAMKSWGGRSRVFTALRAFVVLRRGARECAYAQSVVTTSADSTGEAGAVYGYQRLAVRVPPASVQALTLINAGAGAIEVVFSKAAAASNTPGHPIASGSTLRKEIAVEAAFVRLTSGSRAEVVLEAEVL